MKPAALKAHREKLRSMGICTRCHKNNAGDGRSICIDCQEKANENVIKLRLNKARCINCLNYIEAERIGKRTCVKCAKKRKERRVRIAVDPTICNSCEKPLGEFSIIIGAKYCPKCREYTNIKSRRQNDKKKHKIGL